MKCKFCGVRETECMTTEDEPICLPCVRDKKFGLCKKTQKFVAERGFVCENNCANCVYDVKVKNREDKQNEFKEICIYCGSRIKQFAITHPKGAFFASLIGIFIILCGVLSANNSSDYSSDSYSGSSYSSNSYEYDDYSSSYFSNEYGTSTTRCAHSGCSNYIASSGDTNCCTIHSNRCWECNCYIDEDAMSCMSCLRSALQ